MENVKTSQVVTITMIMEVKYFIR